MLNGHPGISLENPGILLGTHGERDDDGASHARGRGGSLVDGSLRHPDERTAVDPARVFAASGQNKRQMSSYGCPPLPCPNSGNSCSRVDFLQRADTDRFELQRPDRADAGTGPGCCREVGNTPGKRCPPDDHRVAHDLRVILDRVDDEIHFRTCSESLHLASARPVSRCRRS